jgi:hypothetical protein
MAALERPPGGLVLDSCEHGAQHDRRRAMQHAEAFGFVSSVALPFAGELRFRDRMSSCQPRIRRDRPIPDHDPNIRERSCLRRVQSAHRRPCGSGVFCGDRQP